MSFEPLEPTYYGMTGADAAYIKRRGLVPDASGSYPRLDESSKIARINSCGIPGSNTVPINLSDKLLLLEIRRARAIMEGLLKLYRSRREQNGSANRQETSEKDEYSCRIS